MEITTARFEELVRQAIDRVPEPFAAALAAVPVTVHERSPEDDPGLYGRYSGVPLDERGGEYPHLPSVIEVFVHPLADDCRDDDELREEVRITVLHELGHHLGMDEDTLERLGYA